MRFLSVALVLLAAALPAQSFYYSPDNDPTTGGANVIPFGNGTAGTWENQRGQFLFRAANLPGRPGLVRSVGFAAATTSGNYDYTALVLRLGHNTSGSLITSFTGNFSSPPQTVYNVRNASWPVVASTFSHIPLDRPFIYNGTDNIVVDVIAIGSHLSPKSGFRTGSDPRAYSRVFTPIADMIHYGQGCLGSHKKTPALVALSHPMVGTTRFDIGVADALPNAAALLLGGVSSATFASLPLPLDLRPFGAGGCSLLTSIELSGFATTDAQGEGAVSLAIPYDPVFHGVSIFFQWLIPDVTANAFGAITSDGLQAILDLIEGTVTMGTSAGLKMAMEIL